MFLMQHGKSTLKWEFWCFYSKQCKKRNVTVGVPLGVGGCPSTSITSWARG